MACSEQKHRARDSTILCLEWAGGRLGEVLAKGSLSGWEKNLLKWDGWTPCKLG